MWFDAETYGFGHIYWKKMLTENFIFVQCDSWNPHLILETSPLSKLIRKKGNL